MEGHDGIKVTMIERGMEAVMIFQGAMEGFCGRRSY